MKLINRPLILIIAAVVIIGFLVLYLSGALTKNPGGSSGCFLIPAYAHNANGTISTAYVNGTFINRSQVLSLIEGYGTGCCSEAALNNIGSNASIAYNLSRQFNVALANDKSSCASGAYS